MQFVAATLRWQRLILAVVLAAAALFFTRATYDVFNTAKATVIALGALAIVAVGVVRISRTRRVVVPATRVWLAVGGFLLALVAATVVSPTPLWSVVGRPGRHTGLAMYAVYAVLLAAAVRLYARESPAHLVKALVITAVPVSLYGLAQAAGIEPFGWDAVEGGPQVFSTFGNANFFSAWLAIIVPLAVWGALTRTWPAPARAASGLLAAVAVVAADASHSLQGPVAAAAGTALVGAVWLFTAGGVVRRIRGPLVAAAAGAVVAIGAALATGVGPSAGVREGVASSLGSRLPKWQVALDIFRDRPLFGVGLGNYGSWFHTYRPESEAVRGLARSVDAPHNVFLDMLASGGILLFVAYLSVVAVTGWALVVGLRRLAGEERLLLAAFGGAWLAYQVQSLVSIDVPPLAVLHWVLAGVIIAVGANPPLRERPLPGAPPLPSTRPGRKRKAPPVPLVPAHPGVVAGLVVGLIAGLWAATLPIRADAAAMDGVGHGRAGNSRGATDSYRRASDLARWEPRYPGMLGGAYNELHLPDRAYDAYLEAVRRDPRSLTATLNLARVAVIMDRHDVAGRWYARVLEIDPTTPAVLAEVGRYRLTQGQAESATGLLERAVGLRDDQAEWWVTLGQARSAEGDEQGARQAFQRALEINPSQQDAAEALERLALGG